MSMSIFGEDVEFSVAKAKEYLAQWEELCRRDDGKLWGVNLRTPFAIIDEETRELATNEEGFGNKYPEELVISATGFEYKGKHWGIAPWKLVEAADEKERMKTFVHEAFHALQYSLFEDSDDDENNAHLEELDARVLFIVEMNALLEALRGEGEERLNAVRSALFARAQRRQVYGARAEANAEILEGTAVYTETMIVEPDGIFNKMETEIQTLPRLGDGLATNFGYVSGAMYCFVLDAFGIEWKPGLSFNSDLGELLSAAIGTPAADMTMLDAYGYSKVMEEEKKKKEAREKMRKLIVDAFETRPILRSFEEGDWGGPARKIVIPGFGLIRRGVIQYIGEFGKMLVNDGNLEKAVTSNGDLDFLIHDDGYRAVFAEEMRIEGNKVIGNYWELELKEGFIVVAKDGNYEIKKV